MLKRRLRKKLKLLLQWQLPRQQSSVQLRKRKHENLRIKRGKRKQSKRKLFKKNKQILVSSQLLRMIG